MIIRYNNGQVFEAILLSRTSDSMRIALPGADDVVELKQISGIWVSDDCEPVIVEFGRTSRPVKKVVEADCICPPELAAQLIQLLFSGEDQPQTALPNAGGASVLAPDDRMIS